ncbi:MAG TPA: HesA/MoeB/ThiF family protein [Candidatus Binatia bacterium]
MRARPLLIREEVFFVRDRAMTVRLTPDQIERYSRQILIPDLGGRGQIRLRQKKVLIVGAGGLGSPAALYLAAAGIGTLGIVDADDVELSNLQRQILHGAPDLGRKKVESAKERLGHLNPEVEVRAHAVRLEEGNAREIIDGYDFIIDGSDNFETKFLVNDITVAMDKAFSHAGIVRFQGQTMTVLPRRSACYRCLFREPPAPGEIMGCQQAGILGVVAGTVGSLQATEAIKYLLGMEDELLTDRLLSYDARAMKFRVIEIHRDPRCKACGDGASANKENRATG